MNLLQNPPQLAARKFRMWLIRSRSFIQRHMVAVRDLSLVAVGTLVALYLIYAVDVFENEDALGPRGARIELDEALLVGGLLALALLVFCARQHFSQKREMARRIIAEQRIRELAYQDGLTGLPNRRSFDDLLKNAIAAPPGANASHGVFLLDLNGFKQINDVHGHGVGDEVLALVARRLLSAMRGDDMVARFGGDEFAILAPHLRGPEAATNVALRVIEALAAPISAGGGLHNVGIGIGVALIPGDAATVEEALRKADIALYRAKVERRSALRFFEEEMDTRVKGRAAMESALRLAIEAGRITPVYRPTLNLKSREVSGFEAVPHWMDPAQGEIPLERFIAIAEEVGLIHTLAEDILRQACLAAISWPNDVKLAIDVYPGQLKDPNLSTRIIGILADTGLPPERLEIEITESALVADVEGAQAALGSLRALGVRIALDNFGTGYSSLYHLRNFGFDKIKIDRSFIQAMGSERESAGIVSALIGLGHGFGLTIAADGVDGADQEASLMTTGCEQGQLFSVPLSASEAQQLLVHHIKTA